MDSKTRKRRQFILSLVASNRGILSVCTPLLVGVTLLGVAMPFMTGRLIDALAYGRSPWTPLGILSVLLLLRTVLGPVVQRLLCVRSRAIETDLQLRVLRETMELPPAFLARMTDGECLARMTRDAYAVGGFFRGLYPRLIQAAALLLASGAALCSRSVSLAVAFVVFFPLVLVVFMPFSRRFSENAHRVRSGGDDSFNALFEFLFALPLLRMYGAQRRFADEPECVLRKLRDGNVKTDVFALTFGFLLELLLVVGQIAVLGVAGAFAVRGRIPVGDVVVYQMLFIAALQSVQGVIGLLPDFAAVREGAESLCETFAETARDEKDGRLDAFKSLSFDHVTFSYPQAADHPVVEDFSATLHKGSVVGLVGQNGAGKSTLLKLAVGALEPQKGEIRVNGRALAEIGAGSFRHRVGIVFQDSILVPGTIRDNLMLRDPAIQSENIAQALALSGFDAVVAQFPKGLETPVGNRFRALSGGERQRLALARALIRNPDVLVLDEITNHLDAASRKTIADLIARLRPTRLILLAGHDPELARLCDRTIQV